jgi:hypothetical protein
VSKDGLVAFKHGARAACLRYPSELGSEPMVNRVDPTAAIVGPRTRNQ